MITLIIGLQICPEYSPALLRAMKTGFGLFSALCAAGILLSLNRGKLHVRNKHHR